MTPVERILSFLREIGLQAEILPGAKGFIDGVEIREGGIFADPDCQVSGLLHDAGHIAVTPGRFRTLMSGAMFKGVRMMLEAVKGRHPDDFLHRAAMQTGDCEATAWAFAAGTHLGFAPEQIITNNEYDGEGENIRFMLSVGGYFGINGMAHAGFCSSNRREFRGLPAYPKLAKWVQDY